MSSVRLCRSSRLVLVLLTLQEKKWKGGNVGQVRQAALDGVVGKGLIKLVDATPVQPLVLWEVPSLLEAKQDKAKSNAPVSSAACGSCQHICSPSEHALHAMLQWIRPML